MTAPRTVGIEVPQTPIFRVPEIAQEPRVHTRLPRLHAEDELQVDRLNFDLCVVAASVILDKQNLISFVSAGAACETKTKPCVGFGERCALETFSYTS